MAWGTTVRTTLAGLPLALAASGAASAGPSGGGHPLLFETRGLVAFAGEIAALGLPQRAYDLGLNSIDAAYVDWLARDDVGREFVNQCRRLDIDVVYAFHVVSGCLPRSLFAGDPSLFRMNEAGERTPDANLCVHSERALEILCENAGKYVGAFYPASHRYYLWGDDSHSWCHCPKCREFSPSDQALIMENRLLAALRQVDPQAQVSHLAYLATLKAPTRVKPEPGVFLQFAPIERNTTRPLSDADAVDPAYNLRHGEIVTALEANLEVFGREGAEVLEYWLDESRQAHWDRKNLAPLAWDRESFLEDLRVYARAGVRRIRTYAVWIDEEYVARYGVPEALAEYAEGLLRWRWVNGKPIERRAPAVLP